MNKIIGLTKHVTLNDKREVVLANFEQMREPLLVGVEGKANPGLTLDQRQALHEFQEELGIEWVNLDETYRG